MAKCDQHDWKLTGKHGVHVEFPTKTQGIKQVYAFYVRCTKCRQDGYKRYPEAKVIFTWANLG